VIICDTREGRDLTARASIGFDPFPLRHFDSTSSFAKKRGFPHPPLLFFPVVPPACSLSLRVVTPPPSNELPFSSCRPATVISTSSPFSRSVFLHLLLRLLPRASSLSRGSRRLFLPRGCFIRRQKNIAAESRWRWGPDAVSRNPPPPPSSFRRLPSAPLLPQAGETK